MGEEPSPAAAPGPECHPEGTTPVTAQLRARLEGADGEQKPGTKPTGLPSFTHRVPHSAGWPSRRPQTCVSRGVHRREPPGSRYLRVTGGPAAAPQRGSGLAALHASLTSVGRRSSFCAPWSPRSFFALTEVEPVYRAVLTSGVRHSDSAMRVCSFPYSVSLQAVTRY